MDRGRGARTSQGTGPAGEHGSWPEIFWSPRYVGRRPRARPGRAVQQRPYPWSLRNRGTAPGGQDERQGRMDAGIGCGPARWSPRGLHSIGSSRSQPPSLLAHRDQERTSGERLSTAALDVLNQTFVPDPPDLADRDHAGHSPNSAEQRPGAIHQLAIAHTDDTRGPRVPDRHRSLVAVVDRARGVLIEHVEHRPLLRMPDRADRVLRIFTPSTHHVNGTASDPQGSCSVRSPASRARSWRPCVSLHDLSRSVLPSSANLPPSASWAPSFWNTGARCRVPASIVSSPTQRW